jgi:hypothetical protein
MSVSGDRGPVLIVDDDADVRELLTERRYPVE